MLRKLFSPSIEEVLRQTTLFASIYKLQILVVCCYGTRYYLHYWYSEH